MVNKRKDSKEVSMKCSVCEGSGAIRDEDDKFLALCNQCGGTGKKSGPDELLQE